MEIRVCLSPLPSYLLFYESGDAERDTLAPLRSAPQLTRAHSHPLPWCGDRMEGDRMDGEPTQQRETASSAIVSCRTVVKCSRVLFTSLESEQDRSGHLLGSSVKQYLLSRHSGTTEIFPRTWPFQRRLPIWRRCIK